MTQHILVIEDEFQIAAIHRDYLNAAGYEVTCLDDGTQAVEWIRDNTPDLILLDLMLPVKDGHTICQEVRQFSNVPIIMVTAKVDEIDRLLGLEQGADDYICKPFSAREVVARVRAVLRRQEPTYYERAQSALQFNEDTLSVSTASTQIELTVVEFELLKALVSHPGKIFSRSRLAAIIYSDHRIVSERTIDSHIKKIRKKLAAEPINLTIQSVYGAGYKAEPNDDSCDL
ncbi:response regulator [Reinekea blandensis]|uniref:Possible baeR Response regulators consisting of a CheY-like receiver domain and a HTH DNA-binding domain n=1 Tax=Reinekea blandensis MED297 TaxID=314283 RepID=A4BHP6_9GAMM|nr:response regulator [Reinekea blandensis]EAR08301.1 possible baeR; Response regulators consisting of a CheY-like receiver domain and a HTH DNA-binding domain [Reinekea sp. MED297] [Reinekea blandensis MED297]